MSQDLDELAVRWLQEDDTTRAYDPETEATRAFTWVACEEVIVVGHLADATEFMRRVQYALGDNTWGELEGVGKCRDGRIQAWDLPGVPSLPFARRSIVAKALNVSPHMGL